MDARVRLVLMDTKSYGWLETYSGGEIELIMNSVQGGIKRE